MKAVKEGYRVAVVGASSLLGKELLSVLEERAFPVSRLVTFEADEEEPDLPIIDLREESQAVIEDHEVSESELDFAFLVVRPRTLPAFLTSALRPRALVSDLDDRVASGRPAAESLHGAVRRLTDNGGRGHCFIIDLTGGGVGEGWGEALAEGAALHRTVQGAALHRTVQGAAEPAWPVSQRVSVPFLDRRFPAGPAADRSGARGLPARLDSAHASTSPSALSLSQGRPEPVEGQAGPEAGASAFFLSAHPAVIVISSLLLRLAARFRLERAVAQVFVSASEIGPRAIEELQKQTVSLLSFQKPPHKVFGAQLAFNLLARLGRSGEPCLTDLESRLREQLRQYLGGRVPLPALRLVQAPVFYSMALSLYVETAPPVTAEEAAAALSGERLRVRRLPQDAPTQVEAVGSNDILVDAVATDAAHPTGIWLWAVADNLRLAALNAVEIAESLAKNI